MLKGILSKGITSLAVVGSAYATPLDSRFLVEYGEASAPNKVIEYIAFNCPQCVELFQKDFQKIQKDYLDAGKLSWTFIAVPVDIPSVIALECLKILGEEDRKVFLEEVLQSLISIPDESQATFLVAVMEVFGHDISELLDLNKLKQTEAFQAAFAYTSSEDAVKEVPSFSINGELYPNLPTADFFQAKFGASL